MSFWRCHYHFIWATRDRLPVIDAARERIVGSNIIAAANEKQLKLHGFGIMPDHVHVAVSIPPRHSVAEIAKLMKGASSHHLAAKSSSAAEWPGWQREYGVLTFGDASIDRVTAYVRNQKDHHAQGSIWKPFEALLPDEYPDISA